MKYFKFFALVALLALISAPLAFAQTADTTTQGSSPVVITTTTETQAQIDAQDVDTLAKEITAYQLKAADPSTGFFARLVIRAKIHQLQNELNIQQALQ